MNSYNEKLKECLREVYECVYKEGYIIYMVYVNDDQWAPWVNFDFSAYFEDLLNPSDTELILCGA